MIPLYNIKLIVKPDAVIIPRYRLTFAIKLDANKMKLFTRLRWYSESVCVFDIITLQF